MRALVPIVVLAACVAVGSDPVSSSSATGDRSRSCVGLDPPSAGAAGAGFEPGPNYSGHWGLDYRGEPESPVRAAAAGRVTFAGSVVDNLAVTIHHGGGLRTSYSYLGSIAVARGQTVGRGAVIGSLPPVPAHDGLHFSVRIADTYVDPEPLVGCLPRNPSAGLRLIRIS